MQARAEHVRDLRILLDQSAQRETELAGMVRMVMEERFYRPAIVRDGAEPRQQPSMMPIESLNDVATFDDAADAKRMRAGEELERELTSEFQAIFNEHQKSREEKQENAVSA